MDRRQLLKLGGFITASVASLGGLSACGGGMRRDAPAAAPATGANWQFPQSVASGDPKPDGILLWTRVLAADALTESTAATDDRFSIRLCVTAADNASSLGSNRALVGTLVLDAAIPVSGQFDNTVRHKITGLAAAQIYYYQFKAGDVLSRVGCFKTAPAANTEVAQLRFAFVSCQDWSVNHWGAFTALAAEKLDFVVHLGDYIYETVGEAFQTGAVESAHPLLQLPDGTFKSGSSGTKYASSLADYRYLYKRYRSDPRLQAVHERFAMVATWDDHEFSNDCWGDAETYDTVEQHQPARRRNASRAWFEFMPADVVFDSTDEKDIFNIRIYRELQFGLLAHLVMTDERLYRSDHVIPETTVNPATGQAHGSIGARYMVPTRALTAAETQKMSQAGTDTLSLTSILGQTQRTWWQDTMKNSTATWKLWGNEVSLLRMGIDGTTAIATLLALQSVGTLAGRITSALATTSGNVAVASAVVGAMTAGAAQNTASAAALAIAAADGIGTSTLSAALGAGLVATQSAAAVSAFAAAKQAAAGGTSAQVAAGAQAVAFGVIKPEVLIKKQDSVFVIASGLQAALTPFFQKFVLNADLWDGYNAERKTLMKHLRENDIRNVIALTGDIHAFYAGTVSSDFDDTGGGTPMMVDLVTAGISSGSFFNYLKDAVSSISASLAPLVFYPLSIPVAALGSTPVRVNVNLLDHTLTSTTVTALTLAESLRVQLRGQLAARGLPEAQLDATTSAMLTGLQADSVFLHQLLPLCQQLAALDSNPWLKHANSDAQGYAVVTLTPSVLQCDFKQVNQLVGTQAPATPIANQVRLTVRKDLAAVIVN